MACPGGCIMGGGQPIKHSKIRAEVDVQKLRASSLYSIDEKSTIRKSHENPVIKKIYEEYLKNQEVTELKNYYIPNIQKEKNTELINIIFNI